MALPWNYFLTTLIHSILPAIQCNSYQPVFSPVAGNCQAKQGYLRQLDEVLEHSIPKGKSLAGFFAESIQGVGGTVQYPKGYLKEAFAKVRELGGVCVSDEVRGT